MARQHLDYCLYHRRVQIALDLQYCPCLRTHLYAHRTGFVSRLPASACFPACQHRFLATIATHQLEKLSCCPLTDLSLGVSAFAFIKPPLGYPDFFQTALVYDSMLIAVLNYICDFFSCKHFLREDTSHGINSLYALHRLLTFLCEPYRHKILPKPMPIQHNIPPLKPIDEYPDF